MNAAPAYIAISRAPRGTYAWALDQLAAGNQVRRACWPIEVRSPTYTAIWKLYRGGLGGIFKGFSANVIGADNDSWGDLGVDSGGYYPSVEDQFALDWQFVDDVTAAEIAWHDAHRVSRFPNPYVEEFQLRSSRQEFLWALLAAVILIVGLIAFVFG